MPMHRCKARSQLTNTHDHVVNNRNISQLPMPEVDFMPPPASSKTLLKNMTLPQLEDWCESIGEKRSRAMHIWRWMYYDKNWIRDFDDTADRQNGFSKAFRQRARPLASLHGGLHLQSQVRAADGTRKLIFALEGTSGQVETVLIPVIREQGQKERITICVSSQVGCAMNCQFCYTGRMGLLQNLTTAQIVEQLVEARRILAEQPDAPPATNIVFMGMGEPLNNMQAVMDAVAIATEPLGLHFSKNKITVSTVGLVPEIRRFCEAGCPAQLAVSLHAPNDRIRDWIAPVNRRYNLDMLMNCLREHFPKGVKAGWHGRHVLFEYVMLKGVNDAPEHARELLQLVDGVECKFNLIVFNPHKGTQFEASPREAVLQFRSILIQGGLVCTVRDSRGPDEMAACGQLGNPALVQTTAPILPRPDFV